MACPTRSCATAYPSVPECAKSWSFPDSSNAPGRAGKVTIHGDGLQFRNYIYVEDLAAAHVLALGAAAAGQVFNLDGPAPVSVRYVAELACELIDPGAEIEYTAARPGDYRRS